ncbi:MAG: ATP-binding protein [Gemmatimonadales bacterium]
MTAASVVRRASFLVGDSEMARRMRDLDWSATALGPVDSWPQSLRSAVSILLPSRAQIVLFWGPDLTTLYNDAYRPVFGAKHPRALGQPAREAWNEIWDAGLKELFEGVLRTGEAYWARDRLFFLERHGYPEETFFDVSYDPVRDESERVGGVFCIVSETTFRVVGERRLKTLRELSALSAEEVRSPEQACRTALRVLAANPNDLPFALIYLLDADARSARLAATAGLPPDSPAAPVAIDLSPGVPAEGWPLQSALAANRMEVIENLRERFGELPRHPWPEPPHAGVVVPFGQRGQDPPAGFLVAGVSSRRRLDDAYRGFFELLATHVGTAIANARAYDEERRRAEALAEIDRVKTLFFSNVSHEFRTPLTLQLGPLEDVLDDVRHPLEPVHRERIEAAHRNSLRLLKLVNTLLDFSRIEAGRNEASYAPVNLARLTADLASSFRSLIERAGLAYDVDCPQLPELVYVDAEMYEKIVLNLVSNAFKFTPAGSISVSLRWHAAAIGAYAELVVRDTGVGIPAGELPHVFQRFHRVRQPGARSQEGTGIGLALVRELVRLHGGDIDVQSEAGAGTTFAVRLRAGASHLPPDRLGGSRSPAAAGRASASFLAEAGRWSSSHLSAELQPPAEPAPAVATVERPRVLVADDNADMREYLERLLGDRYAVEAVSNGTTALHRARERRPDLIIADVMMPGLDGFELLAALRQEPATATVPILLLSARAGEEARVEGLLAGADDYLAKPFNARELVARIDGQLALSRVRREGMDALARSESRYRSVIEASALLIWVAGPDGLIMEPSPSYQHYTGLSTEEFIGFGGLRATHPDDLPGALTAWSRACETGRPYEAMLRIRRRDGVYRWFLSRAVPVAGPGDTIREWIGTCLDVHDHRIAEERMQELQRLDTVATLAGGVSHEVANQMTAVLGLGAFVERALGADHPQTADVRGMVRAASRTAGIARQLLAFSRQQPRRPTPIALNAMLRQSYTLLQQTLGAEYLLELTAGERTGLVLADAGQLEQVLVNLVLNARDALAALGPGRPARVTISTRTCQVPATEAGAHSDDLPAGRYVVLSVLDAGAGMTDHVRARAFTPFFTTKPVGKGTGLGLSSVFGIVKQHQGHVLLDNGPGGGTEVSIWLPELPDRQVRPDDAPPTPGTDGPAGQSRTVLMVDDEPVVRTLTRRMLEGAGFRVLEASTTGQAIALLRDLIAAVDAVVCDVVMPDGGGRAVGDFVATLPDGPPVLFISGFPGDELAQRKLLSPGANLLTKPFAPEELVQAVVGLMVGRRPVGHADAAARAGGDAASR